LAVEPEDAGWHFCRLLSGQASKKKGDKGRQLPEFLAAAGVHSLTAHRVFMTDAPFFY